MSTLPAPAGSPPSLAGELRDVAFVEFANALAFSAFVPFLALWLTGPVGMSAALAGITGFAVYSVTAIAGSAFGGRLSDLIGRRTTMLFGLGAGTFRLAALALTEDPVAVTVLIAFGGLVDSVVQPAIGALVADRVAVTRLNEAYGTVRAARTIGFGLGPVLGAALVPVSFGAVLLAAAACRGAAFAAAFFVREPARDGAPAAATAARSVIRDGTFVRILAATGLLVMFYGWYETVVPVHLESRGIEVSTWGAIYAGGAVFTALLAVRVSRLIDQWPRFQRWVMAGGLVYGAGFLLLLPGSLAAILPAVALVAVAQMILLPIESTLAARLAPVGRTGSYQGALSLVHALAFATGPALGLALYDATSAAAAFVVAAAVLPLGGLVLSSAIGAAVGRGRLGLTRPTTATRVTGVEPSAMAGAQHERLVRDAERQVKRLNRRYRQTVAAQEAWRTRLGLGAVVALAGVAALATVLVHQLSVDRDAGLEPDVLIAVVASGTAMAVAGCVYQYFSERTRRTLADARLRRLEQAEQEAVKQLHDARQNLADLG